MNTADVELILNLSSLYLARNCELPQGVNEWQPSIEALSYSDGQWRAEVAVAVSSATGNPMGLLLIITYNMVTGKATLEEYERYSEKPVDLEEFLQILDT